MQTSGSHVLKMIQGRNFESGLETWLGETWVVSFSKVVCCVMDCEGCIMINEVTAEHDCTAMSFRGKME